MGAEVVALSTTRQKKDEALQLGAQDFAVLDHVELESPVDVLVVTSSSLPDWERLLDTRLPARGGVIVILTASPIALNINARSMLSNGWRVHFSLVASRADHDEMLQFAASHGVRPRIQVYKFDGSPCIEKAFKNIAENKARYRVVLEF